MAPPVIRVGLIGHGTVGSAFAEQFLARQGELALHAGSQLKLTQIAVHDPASRGRAPSVPFHSDAAAIAHDPSVDIVVEASGAPAAAAWLRAALERGASVVTANKQAVAHDAALLAALARGESRLHCEGAVAAAVPVIRALRESLAGEDILGIRGVLNGTTTFILSHIEAGRGYHDALAEAQRSGLSEADPSDDLNGADAAAKLAILCTIAWHAPFAAENVVAEGIDCETVPALLRRTPAGSCVRMVATASRERGRVVARVAPAVLRANDALALATGVLNVVEVRSALAGTLVWSGAGAGGRATASALLADVLAATRWIVRRRRPRVAA